MIERRKIEIIHMTPEEIEEKYGYTVEQQLEDQRLYGGGPDGPQDDASAPVRRV